MMLDMKRTFDEVVESPRHARRRPSRSWTTPSTRRCRARSPARRSTWRWRSSASCARRADGRQLGPDRRRHPAVPLRAGLPRRARAARRRSSTAGSSGCCWRRRGGPAAAGSSTAGFGMVTGALTKILGGQVLQRPADVRGRPGHDVRRLPGSGPSRPTSCCRRPARRSWSWRRPSRTRCARRRTSSSGSARSGCRSPAWSSTGPARAGAASLSADEAMAAAERLEEASPTAPAHRGAAAAARGPGADGRAGGGAAARFAAAHPDVATAVVPALAGDVHDLDGLRVIGGAARRQG